MDLSDKELEFLRTAFAFRCATIEETAKALAAIEELVRLRAERPHLEALARLVSNVASGHNERDRDGMVGWTTKAQVQLMDAADRASRALGGPQDAITRKPSPEVHHGLDTDERVCFYEQDFYPLSNFSAFTLTWKGIRFDTSEAAYHWEKFTDHPAVQELIRYAPSAHVAFKIAEQNAALRRKDWPFMKVVIMRQIIRAKVSQHEYVRRKLLATGDRELVENSWRDDFWGWGPNRDGKNMLGKLWMEIRAEIR